MRSFRLIIVSPIPYESYQVAQFIQSIRDAPKEALCEITSCWNEKNTQINQYIPKTVRTITEMNSDMNMMEFLCYKFKNPCKYVFMGEPVSVHCKRCPPPVVVQSTSIPSLITNSKSNSTSPLPKEQPQLLSTGQNRELSSGQPQEISIGQLQPFKTGQEYPGVLPLEKVIELIDFLGDDIIYVEEVFQRYATRSLSPDPKLNIPGVVRALEKLRARRNSIKLKTEGNDNGSDSKNVRAKLLNHRRPKDDHCSKSRQILRPLDIQKVRLKLRHMITTGIIAVNSLPLTSQQPFLSYTDFIACYVYFLKSKTFNIE